ncbi:hypothetical protein [Cellulomonas sp. Marseille-Q8402]
MRDDLLGSLPPGVILHRDAAAGGIGGHALRRALRDGSLAQVRPGAYVRGAEWSASSPEGRQLLAVRAAARQLVDPVFSHESAAAVWGLPLVGAAGGVHVLGPPGADGRPRGTGTRAGVTRHAAGAGVPVAVRDGLRVTGALDTVLALARDRDLRRALAAADAALRSGLVTGDGLRDEVARRAGARGARRMRVVAALADGRVESAGESVSRARIHLDGFAQPALQVPFVRGGSTVARVDFWWRDARVVGEFDGRKKYRADGVDDRRAVEERVWSEKRREDMIRAAGIRVVRWTWSEAWHPGPLSALLAAAGVPRIGSPAASRTTS